MTKADTSLFVIIGVLVLLVVGISLFAISPLIGRYQSLKVEQEKTNSELAELEQRADTLRELAKDEREVEELGQRALIYLPTTINASPFVMDVAAIGGVAATSVPTVAFQEPDASTKTSNLDEYRVTMTVEGNFSQLKTFLRSLEENLRFSTFSSLVFSQQQQAVSLQLSGTIYSKPENPNLTDTSLTIDNKMKELLFDRKPFGAPIPKEGPGRSDPFASF